ncbi:MAG: hypothetical protein ACXQTI_06950 [Candidatus Nezhaarchaeales archaeon]
MDDSKVRFTKHAMNKFEVLKHYGFKVDMGQVIKTVLNPERLDERDGLYFAIRAIDSKYALRVVYEKRKDYLVTFYSVRRERYGV